MERNRNYAEDKNTLTPFRMLMSEHEAAAFLGISYRTLHRLRTQANLSPELPYSCLGGVIRYNPKDLEEWAKTQRFPTKRGRKKA